MGDRAAPQLPLPPTLNENPGPAAPTMTRLRLLPLLLLLLLPASAGAAGAAQGELETSGLAVQGEAHLEGRLAVFESDPREDSGGDPAGRWSLAAAHLRIERDWEGSPALPLVTIAGSEDTIVSEHADVRAASGEARLYSYIYVAPLEGRTPPSVAATWAAVEMGVSRAPAERHEAFVVSQRGRLEADTGASAVATSGRAFCLVVEGDFLVSLWDWDFNVQDAQRGSDEWTGDRNVPGADPLVAHQRQQAYLFVEGGRLELAVDNPRDARLHLAPATLSSLGDVVLAQAAGRMETTQGVLEVPGEPVLLEGPVEVAFGTAGDRLSVRVLRSEGAAWGGQTYALGGGEGARLLWLWLLGAATLLGAGAVGAHRLRSGWAYRRMDEAMAAQQYQRALGFARRLLRSRRHGAEAVVAHAVGLLRLRRPDEALEFLDANPRGDTSLREYLRAFAYALKEEWTLAAATLDACIRHNPALEREVAVNPVFRPLWGRYGASADVA